MMTTSQWRDENLYAPLIPTRASVDIVPCSSPALAKSAASASGKLAGIRVNSEPDRAPDPSKLRGGAKMASRMDCT